MFNPNQPPPADALRRYDHHANQPIHLEADTYNILHLPNLPCQGQTRHGTTPTRGQLSELVGHMCHWCLDQYVRPDNQHLDHNNPHHNAAANELTRLIHPQQHHNELHKAIAAAKTGDLRPATTTYIRHTETTNDPHTIHPTFRQWHTHQLQHGHTQLLHTIDQQQPTDLQLAEQLTVREAQRHVPFRETIRQAIIHTNPDLFRSAADPIRRHIHWKLTELAEEHNLGRDTADRQAASQQMADHLHIQAAKHHTPPPAVRKTHANQLQQIAQQLISITHQHLAETFAGTTTLPLHGDHPPSTPVLLWIRNIRQLLQNSDDAWPLLRHGNPQQLHTNQMLTIVPYITTRQHDLRSFTNAGPINPLLEAHQQPPVTYTPDGRLQLTDDIRQLLQIVAGSLPGLPPEPTQIRNLTTATLTALAPAGH